MPDRKSDSGIVPMKSGNSDGGKARYLVIALKRETFTTHGGRNINGNKTYKDSRIS